MIRIAVCLLLAALFWGLACNEATAALRWKHRSGHWHAHRVAAVYICVVVALLFVWGAFG